MTKSTKPKAKRPQREVQEQDRADAHPSGTPCGASIPEMMKSTGWARHTASAASWPAA